MHIKDKGLRREFRKAMSNDQKIDQQEMASILAAAGDGQVLTEDIDGDVALLASSGEARDHFMARANADGSLDLAGIRSGVSKNEGKDLQRMFEGANLTAGAKLSLSDFLTGRATSSMAPVIEDPTLEPTETTDPADIAEPMAPTTEPSVDGPSSIDDPAVTTVSSTTATRAVDFKGETTIAGEWRMKPDTLANTYKGVSPENFLSTNVEVPVLDADGNPTGMKTINRRDNQYFLNDEKTEVGYRLIPVSDEPITLPNGEVVPGSYHLDKMIEGNDYVFMMYTHPEEHRGGLQDLAKESVKPENGITHLAGYQGEGKTVNSPRNYHNYKFKVKGYPATIVTIDNGEEYLGKSMKSAAKVLNPTVKFPSDYKNDKLMAFNLENTFKFYKATLEGDTSITDAPEWNQYCAEHQLMLSSIGLNLPQNLQGYQEIYGDVDGAKLWELAKAKGVEEAPADFEPHYKKMGMEPPRGDFSGAFQESGKAMAWVPETTADLVQDFVTTYAPFDEVGGRVAAGVVEGFKDTVMDRMGLTEDQVNSIAMPVQGLLIEADAKVAGGMSVEDANAWLQENLAPIMEQAREVQVSDDSKTQRYSAPATLMRHVTGVRGQDNGLTYKIIGTVVDTSEVEPASDN